jgi:quinol monooxygenase YgiN
VVTLVNCFEVPAGRDEEFLRQFEVVNSYMRAKPGYLGHKLHRAIAPQASFRFVNIVRWASAADCQNAHDAGFLALIRQPDWAPFRSTPGLYEVVHEAVGHAAAADVWR